ncbi:MAG: hypothetical protein EOM21_13675 [Gammaproteobacteria bacterium]|nr:hypothetical protein [Gammaproteobacteria bacterium]
MSDLAIIASPVSIDGIAVSKDAHERFCLNDLHRAAGGEKRHSPNYWLDLSQTKELIEELRKSLIISDTGIPVTDRINHLEPVVTQQGFGTQGTFVVRELVYSYAMWVSPAFHLKVIRTFDAAQTPQTYIAALEAHLETVKRNAALEAEKAQLVQKIEVDEPFVEIGRAITHETSLTRRDWVTMLKADHSLKIKEKELTQWLIDCGYCYREPLKGELRAYAHSDRLFHLQYEVIHGFHRPVLKITGEGVLELTPKVLAYFRDSK